MIERWIETNETSLTIVQYSVWSPLHLKTTAFEAMIYIVS